MITHIPGQKWQIVAEFPKKNRRCDNLIWLYHIIIYDSYVIGENWWKWGKIRCPFKIFISNGKSRRFSSDLFAMFECFFRSKVPGWWQGYARS
jgi:hypothetical protein